MFGFEIVKCVLGQKIERKATGNRGRQIFQGKGRIQKFTILNGRIVY